MTDKEKFAALGEVLRQIKDSMLLESRPAKDDERIAALEARLAKLERENALFKSQWLDRNAYSDVRGYRPSSAEVRKFWTGDGWSGL